jgi:hypothetical protein
MQLQTDLRQASSDRVPDLASGFHQDRSFGDTRALDARKCLLSTV